MVVYVDDMLLLASLRDMDSLWRDLEKSVQYKDPAAPLQRYLGALPFRRLRPQKVESTPKFANIDE